MHILSSLSTIRLLLTVLPIGGLPPIYSPLRPPAIPLAVRNPYTSVWSSTAEHESLNSQNAMFWTGDGVGWEGIVVVDGVPYEYLGNAVKELPDDSPLKSAIPRRVSFDSQYSNFTFEAGPVNITASFLSPVIPQDLCRSSIPLSYLTTSIESNDGQQHRVHFYSDVTARWSGVTSEYDIAWDLHRGGLLANGTGNATNSPDEIFSFTVERKNHDLLSEQNDFPHWGNLTYNTSPGGAGNFSYSSGYSTTIRLDFVTNFILNDNIHAGFYGNGDREPVFAFAHDFGIVRKASARYTVGSIQTPIIRYIHRDGVSNLAPWWERCYGSDLLSLIHTHWDDFDTVSNLAATFEAQLRADVDAFYQGTGTPVSNSSILTPPGYLTNGTDQFGHSYTFDPSSAYGFVDTVNGTGLAVPFVSEPEAYYAIVALSARQIMGAYVFAVPPSEDGGTSEALNPLVFQKEISSNGNVNTVDVLYPASPFFLYANPDILKFAMEPLYQFQEDQYYPNGYCIHDLGAHFPNATGHVEGTDEYMPVEESANFILMSYAYYKFTGDGTWIIGHYDLLKQFTQYLIQFTLVPEGQLSTDDFAGTMINQTNLAIKGIVGLQAMASIATLAGETYDALNFSATARSYYSQWEYYAIDPSHQHTTLAYQWRSSWGLLYNIFFDKLLNMGLVNESIYTMQSEWYATVSQVFGVPLDSRNHYTKSDWQIWAAATSSSSTRRLIVDAIAYWLNETVYNVPFSDAYETVGTGDFPQVPDHITFRARPVTGGHFALLALGRTGQTAAATAGDTTGSLFPKNSTKPLPIPDDPVPPKGRRLPAKQWGGTVKRRITRVLTNRPNTRKGNHHPY
ncbi:DUF1793-domain-containing protein [Xylariomycetidae sp. FL0641]|nr:DUF1793-domain-containing protein [Xylariomycetidae sp. FL0641]